MWVARDKDGMLRLFEDKPVKGEYMWVRNSWFKNQFMYLGFKSKSFRDVKWKNNEPIEVDIFSIDKLDVELNDMFCQLCVDYKIPDKIADRFIKKFKKRLCG